MFEVRKTRPRLRALAGVVVALGLGTAPCVAAQSRVGIEGAVMDAAGAPVASALVVVEGTAHIAYSDGRGRFQLTGLRSGVHELVVQRAGYADQRVAVAVDEGAMLTLEITLVAAPTYGEQLTVTASRREERLDRQPVSIGVVDADEIALMQPRHVAEPLNRIPGVHIVAFEGEGTHNAVRQPLCCRPTLLMMEDGVPLTSPAFYSTSLLKLVNYAQARQIEVLKGPGTAAYGSDGVTGVVHFRTQDPPIAPSWTATIEAGGAGYRRALTSAGVTRGRHGLLGTLNVSDADGRRQNPYSRQSASAVWTTGVGASAALRTVGSVNLTSSTGTDDQTPEQFASRSSFNPYPIAFSDFASVRLSSTYTRQAGDHGLTVTPFFRWTDTDFVPGWQLSFNPVVWQWDETSLGLRTQWRYDIPGRPVAISTGVDLDSTDGARQEPRITPVDVGGIWVDWSLRTEPPAYDYGFAYRGASAYSQIEAAPFARIRVDAGVRYDWAQYDYRNHLPVVQTGSTRRPADAVREYQQVTPKLGVTMDAGPGVTVFGAYRRGFRVPTEAQLFKQQASENTLDLRPVKADSVEIGARVRLAQRARIEAAVYSMRLTDDILRFRTLDNRTETSNNGRTRHRGVEASAMLALTSDLQVAVGYTYAVHRFTLWRPSATVDLSGLEMDGAPRHQWNAHVTWTPALARGGRVQMEWQGLGDYWLDTANTVRQEGYDVFHLRATVPVGRRLEAGLRVANLFDRLHAAQGFLGFGPVPRLLNPGEYRTVYASLTARF